jgi:hypothetical protein
VQSLGIAVDVGIMKLDSKYMPILSITGPEDLRGQAEEVRLPLVAVFATLR